MLYFRCKNLALDIRDCVSLVGHGSSVVGDSLRNLGKFILPHIACVIQMIHYKAIGPFYPVKICQGK